MQYIMHAMNTEQLSIYIKGSPTTHINICYLKIVIGANRSGVSNRFSSEGVEKTRFYHPAIGSRSLITNLPTINLSTLLTMLYVGTEDMSLLKYILIVVAFERG